MRVSITQGVYLTDCLALDVVLIAMMSSHYPNPDQRNVPALGRIGDVDDILASVRIEGGEVRGLGIPYSDHTY